MKKSTGYILNGKYVKAGEVPADATRPRVNPAHKQYEAERMREDYRRDLIQPYLPNGQPNPEFIEAYPQESITYGFVKPEEKNA